MPLALRSPEKYFWVEDNRFRGGFSQKLGSRGRSIAYMFSVQKRCSYLLGSKIIRQALVLRSLLEPTSPSSTSWPTNISSRIGKPSTNPLVLKRKKVSVSVKRLPQWRSIKHTCPETCRAKIEKLLLERKVL